MNEKLLAWLDEVKKILHAWRSWTEALSTQGERPVYFDRERDAEALAELRAMLKEPTDEERKGMLEWLKRWIQKCIPIPDGSNEPCETCVKNNPKNSKQCQDAEDAITALIKAKRTVTREIRDRDELWCRALIHELDTKDIAGVTRHFNSIRPDKGDVPIFNENGHSNEEKP